MSFLFKPFIERGFWRMTQIFADLLATKKEFMEMDELLHKELTGAILKLFYEVYNELGYGFLERVYQNAMYHEHKSNGYEVEAQKRIVVYYKDIIVGNIRQTLL